MTNFEEQLRETGTLVYTNKGVSMLPLLRQDRDVMVIRYKTDGFEKNDAVLFLRDNGQYILHRITRVNGDGTYYIMGDNCTAGETVPREKIFGILTQVKRGKRLINTTDRFYKLYVALVPVRRFFIPPARLARRVLAKMYRAVFPRKDKQ